MSPDAVWLSRDFVPKEWPQLDAGHLYMVLLICNNRWRRGSHPAIALRQGAPALQKECSKQLACKSAVTPLNVYTCQIVAAAIVSVEAEAEAVAVPAALEGAVEVVGAPSLAAQH